MDSPSVLHIDTGRHFRGGQRQVYLLTRELKLLGIDQVLACPKSGSLTAKVDNIPQVHLSPHSLFRKMFTGILRDAVEHNNINIIHAHDSEAHTLGILLKRKVPELKLLVTRRVIFPPSSAASVKHKYIKPVDGYIAISKAVAASLKALGLPDSRIDVVPSGIDFDDILAMVKANAAYSEISNRYNHVIVSAGALTEEKDFATAIDAFALVSRKLEQVALVIFGEGNMRAALEKKIVSMKLSDVYLMGYHEPLAPILKTADLFLLTSKSEGLNSAAIEAAACGLPQVVSNIGGLPEIVENNYNGLLCRAGDAEDFAGAIIRLLSDDSLHRQMSEKALIKARQFDIKQLAPRIVDLYNRLLVY